MKAVILDGSQANDNTGERVRAALAWRLQARGWEAENFTLCEQKIGNCAGDFFCWVRSPGVCNVNDDNRAISESLINSDLMVYLTPITFGGYGSTLKRLVDHQIQNISPFFAMVEGETHHRKRYLENPDLLVVGWMDEPDARSEAVFRHLVQRNAINFHAEKWASGVVLASQTDRELQASADEWLNALQGGGSTQRVELPASSDSSTAPGTASDGSPVDIRRALLLVGSPKTRKSTSNSLGSYLYEQLNTHSVQTETIYLHTVLRNARKMQALLDAVKAADLVTLAFPIYVDTLPAPVIEALERIATHRRECDPSRQQFFTAIANCGFPESHHCANAQAICQAFSQQAGFKWAGSLALGAGEMVNGVSLVEAGGMSIRIRCSLNLSAEALAQGQAIPKAAKEMMAKPVIPHWVYRLMGGLRWIRSAKSCGALRLLNRRPYLAQPKGNGQKDSREASYEPAVISPTS